MIVVRDCQDMKDCLQGYVEGALTGDDRAEVEHHLRGCPDCRQELRDMREVGGLLKGSIGAMPMSRSFLEETGRRLQEVSRETCEELEEATEVAQVGFLDSLEQRFGSAPWWLISGAFHALVLLLVTLIGMAILRGNEQDVVIVTDLEQRQEPEEIEEVKERTIIPKPIPIEDVEVSDQQPIVTHEEVEIAEVVETDNDSEYSETRGEDGISDVWLGGSGTVAALGLGGGGGGAFGRPNGRGGRLRRAIRGGGGKRTESAVDKALEWLARHQEADGRWSTRRTEGNHDWDPGVTGLALLAFLGAGHTEKIGKYKPTVQAAVRWIISQQRTDGAIGTDPMYKDHGGGYGYHHVICGMALAEASAMARVPATTLAAQKAIDYACEKHQQGSGSNRLGFRYRPKQAGDTSNTGWFVMQLKSAKVAGLKVDPASVEGVMKFFKSMEVTVKGAERADASWDKGNYRYGYRKGLEKVGVTNTSIGVLAHLFTGTKPEEVTGAAAWLMRTNPPTWSPALGPCYAGPEHTWPMYYAYYTTLNMFQIGGDLWNNWNTGLKRMLLPNQRRDGDFDGSWDPLSRREKEAGRAYTTALGAMCLEVYYRYLPMYRE